MTYAVMFECDDGTWRLIDDTAGARWERKRHTITWSVEATFEAAANTANPFAANPTVHKVWIEARP